MLSSQGMQTNSTDVNTTDVNTTDAHTTDVKTIETTSMENRQLHSSQKEAMKKMAEFSGENNEPDIDEWLFDLTNLFSLMKLNDETKILETMGKLTGPALKWYQENLRSFGKWENAEKSLRERFTEFTSDGEVMQEFFQIQQEENQSITSFYEIVTRKYRKAKNFITEPQLITVLQAGAKNSLKEYLIRNEKDIETPDDWLQLAREEEYIQKRIQQQRNGFYAEPAQQPFFAPPLPTLTIQPKSTNRPPLQRAHGTRYDGQHQQHRQIKPGYTRTQLTPNNQNRRPYVGNKTRNNNSCLICKRNNHPTNKCYYKKEKGCFKCGQLDHQIRDCPQRHFFE